MIKIRITDLVCSSFQFTISMLSSYDHMFVVLAYDNMCSSGLDNTKRLLWWTLLLF